MYVNNEDSITSFYSFVIEDVINNIKDMFIEECIEIKVLRRLKILWQNKMSIDSKEPEDIIYELSDLFADDATLNPEPGLVGILIKPRKIDQPILTEVVDTPKITEVKIIPEIIPAPHLITAQMIATMELPQLDGDDSEESSSDDSSDSKDSNLSGSDKIESDPLNSGDDMSDITEVFETDNWILCQFDKILRYEDTWRFYFTKGFMHLDGLDFVFNKANGESEF